MATPKNAPYKLAQRKAEHLAGRGRVIFLSVETGPMLAWPITRTAHAVRDGKLNKKSGRRLATAYT